MADPPEMLYLRGFLTTRAGTPYGGGHPGEDFGA